MKFQCKNCKNIFEKKYVYGKNPQFCNQKCFLEYVKKNGFDSTKRKNAELMVKIYKLLPEQEREGFISLVSKIYGFSREYFYQLLRKNI